MENSRKSFFNELGFKPTIEKLVDLTAKLYLEDDKSVCNLRSIGWADLRYNPNVKFTRNDTIPCIIARAGIV